jgi:5-(carboxyamino)imidazole ribonucleotide synthase
MLHPPAVALGIDLAVLSGSASDSAAQVVARHVVGDEAGLGDLRAFADQVDVLTFDHEHVPGEDLRALESAGIRVRPGSAALAHAQDKAHMRAAFDALGLPVPAHRVVSGEGDVATFAAEVGGYPVVLKTARGGYDGRGVWVVDHPDAGRDAFRAGVPVVAEAFVPFRRELAALVARAPSGQAVAYPVVESVQRDGICVEVVAPAPGLPADTANAAQRLALRIADGLGVVGVLAVELFETDEGQLLVNELAMRPHNTGHWSIDGAVTSQFENHLRAVLDWPLGAPNPLAPVTVMVNVLGGSRTDLATALPHVMTRDPALKVHLYGKSVRPGRKVGHVTVLGDDVEELRARAWHAADALTGVIDP